MKKLSIIVPIYNGEKRIIKCLESIVSQTYERIELIILNDGSKDSSDNLVRSHLEKFKESGKEIVYEYHENQGVAKTRNYGISIATGDYVTFVDQDDYLPEDYAACYMSNVQNNEYDIVIGGYKRISDEGKVSRVVSLRNEEWSKFVVTAPWAHVYKTTLLKDNDIGFLSTGLGEDVYFNVLAYAYTDKVKIIPDSNYMWVDNPVSVSNSKQNTIRFDRSPIFLLDEMINHMPEKNGISYEFLEFYFARYIAWYFLFTVRGSKKDDIVKMLDLTNEWLNQHFPEHMKNENISLFRPKGDPISIRVCVWGFYLLKKIGLLKSFLLLVSNF